MSVKHSYGDLDVHFGQIKNARVHIYATLADANADNSTANSRLCFVTETNRFYMGRSNNWLKIESVGEVIAPANLPTDETRGALYVVDEDPTLGGAPNVYIYDGAIWNPIKTNLAPQIVLKTSSGALAAARRLLVKLDSTGGSFWLTLPPAPVEGDTLIFKDISGQLHAHPVFVNPESQTIDGLSAMLELSRNYQCLTMQFVGGHWLVLSDV